MADDGGARRRRTHSGECAVEETSSKPSRRRSNKPSLGARSSSEVGARGSSDGLFEKADETSFGSKTRSRSSTPSLDHKENITVAVRVRPLTELELVRGALAKDSGRQRWASEQLSRSLHTLSTAALADGTGSSTAPPRSRPSLRHGAGSGRRDAAAGAAAG